MKKNLILLFVCVVVTAFCFQTISAQFNIKIPKINKPKKEEPKVEKPDSDENQSTPNESKSDENRPAQTQNKGDYLDAPEQTSVPKFLIESLEIRAHNEDKYIKAPSQNDYSSWLPQVNFEVLYLYSAPKLRYQADWFKPDGSLWFSEPLEYIMSSGDFPRLRSPQQSVDINPKAERLSRAERFRRAASAQPIKSGHSRENYGNA